MLLGDILSKSGRSQPVKPHPVEFTAQGEDDKFHKVTARVQAVLVCLDEEQRSSAKVAALAEVESRFKDKVVPSAVLSDEEVVQFLLRALCQPEPQSGRWVPLAATAMELRSSLVWAEVRRLWREYSAYMEREFPEDVDPKTWGDLVEAAKKSSVQDLLTAYGYEKVVKLTTFLASRSG